MNNPIVFESEGFFLNPKEKTGHGIRELLEMDTRFEYKVVNICKSCRNKHKKGCCDNYSRLNRTKTTGIWNAKWNEEYKIPTVKELTNIEKYEKLLQKERDRAHRLKC